jgi:hypothetical protein
MVRTRRQHLQRDPRNRPRRAQASRLTGPQWPPDPYVVLRVTASSDSGSPNQAETLRQTIQAEGYISRPPTTGEREALETGLDAMGIPRAAYGRTRP